MTALLKRYDTYEEICRHFAWQIPERYNIANDVCDRWASDESRVALIYEDDARQVHRYTFRDIQRHANRLANVLVGLGLSRRPGHAVAGAESGMRHRSCGLLEGRSGLGTLLGAVWRGRHRVPLQ